MKLLKIILLTTFSLRFVENSDVSRLISSLVLQSRGNQTESTVMLSRLEMTTDFDFFEEISTEVMIENPLNPVFISTLQFSSDKIDIAFVAFVIMTLGAFDSVREFSISR